MVKTILYLSDFRDPPLEKWRKLAEYRRENLIREHAYYNPVSITKPAQLVESSRKAAINLETLVGNAADVTAIGTKQNERIEIETISSEPKRVSVVQAPYVLPEPLEPVNTSHAATITQDTKDMPLTDTPLTDTPLISKTISSDSARYDAADKLPQSRLQLRRQYKSRDDEYFRQDSKHSVQNLREYVGRKLKIPFIAFVCAGAAAAIGYGVLQYRKSFHTQKNQYANFSSNTENQTVLPTENATKAIVSYVDSKTETVASSKEIVTSSIVSKQTQSLESIASTNTIVPDTSQTQTMKPEIKPTPKKQVAAATSTVVEKKDIEAPLILERLVDEDKFRQTVSKNVVRNILYFVNVDISKKRDMRIKKDEEVPMWYNFAIPIDPIKESPFEKASNPTVDFNNKKLTADEIRFFGQALYRMYEFAKKEKDPATIFDKKSRDLDIESNFVKILQYEFKIDEEKAKQLTPQAIILAERQFDMTDEQFRNAFEFLNKF